MSTRLLLCVILLCINSFAQTTNAFRVTYNQALFDLPGNAIEALTPSNYVFAGTNMNFLPIYGTITQVDDLGALVWSKRYSDASIGFQINDIKKDPVLNEYYVCGGSESGAAVFMRVDATGAVVVSKKFSISQADGAYLNRVVKTSDGGYVAVGYVTGHDPDGAGAETDFAPINYTNNDGPETEVIGSPLIVKFNANGDHVWHQVFRYYTAATKTPAQRIYNDASLNDVVEVADGYIAVGQYDVNQHNSNTNSDGDDATSNDAVIIKTTFAGAVTYHKQVDNPNTNATASSKYLSAISKTSVGDPIAAGSDNGKELIMKYGANGGFSLTFSRDFTYSTFFGAPDPVDVSQIYEVDGGTDLVTMAMYIKPLSFTFANSIHRVNPTATTNTWSKYYTFNLATILPRGGKTSDGGYIMNSTVMGGVNFDYHLIKTDPTGETPITGCAAVSFTPTASAGPSTIADPHANNWSNGTVGPQTLAVTTTVVTPTATVQCSFTSCTPPPAPIIGAITQPTCAVPTGSVALSGLPSVGTWTITALPGGATITGTGTTANFTGLTAGTTYTFTVTDAALCTSLASSNAVISTVPGTSSAPIIGTITQPTCSVAGASVALSGLPATGSWTVTASPGGATITGSGTTGNFTGLTAGTTYTFTVTNASGCTSVASSNAVINTQPVTPTAPIVGTITQPTCSVGTGSVALSGLPATGTWTVTAAPGGATITGTGTTGNFTGLTAGTTYTFTVTNSDLCTSVASTSAIIDAQPTNPSAPIIGTITQPTCSVATGSVDLSGLPASGTWTVTASPGGATITGSGTTGNFSGLTAGTTYTFTVTNVAGCTSNVSTSAAINTQPITPSAPIVGTITQPTCSVSTGSVNLSGLPATGAWTMTASPGGATISGSGTTGNFTGLTAGTTYTFTVTNDAGCTSVASTTAVIDAVAGAPIITLDSQQNVNCNGATTGEITISVTGGQAPYNFQWTPNAGNGSTISNLSAGDYTILVTDDLGCTSTATYTITQGVAIIIDETIENVICESSLGSITTSVSGGTSPYSFLWTPNGEVTPNLVNLTGGNYGLTVTDDLGCSVSENYTISITGSLSIDASPNYSSIDEGESVQISTSGGTNYTWSPPTGLSCTNCANPVATPSETTTYYVTSSDSSGCTGGDTILIEIRIHCGDFYVPNIFSPNGDMNNDYLCIYGSCVRELKYAVYDRWGEKVFETESTVNLDSKNFAEVCWDGTFRDKPLNTGVYAYKLYAELDNGEIIEESGNITLVK